MRTVWDVIKSPVITEKALVAKEETQDRRQLLTLRVDRRATKPEIKNAVESINFSQVQGGKIIVKVGMKEPLASPPQGFAVTNPPRIAVDLPDTVNATGRTQIEAGEGDLKSVSIVQTANRTRLASWAGTSTVTQ